MERKTLQISIDIASSQTCLNTTVFMIIAHRTSVVHIVKGDVPLEQLRKCKKHGTFLLIFQR